MRHRLAGKKLNRDTHHRRALLRNLARELILHGSFTTTVAKAKAVQPLLDKLVTKAKAGALSQRRQVQAVLGSTQLTNQLVDKLAPTFKRHSGFTRIIKTSYQRGDNACQAKIEWVDLPSPTPIDHQPSKEDRATSSKSPSTKTVSPNQPKAKKSSPPKAAVPSFPDTNISQAKSAVAVTKPGIIRQKSGER